MEATRLFVLALVLGLLVTLAGAAGAQEPQLSSNGGCVAGSGDYDPACDVNRDGDTNVIDLELVASHWGGTGTWSTDHNHLGEHWSGDPPGGFDIPWYGLSVEMGGMRGVLAYHYDDFATSWNAGIYGEASIGDGVRGKGTTGVYGETASSAQFAYGVAGYATAGTGESRGVYGSTASSTGGAVGVKGVAASTTGDVKGVIGLSASTDGGVAIAGISLGNRHAGWFETGDWVSTTIVNNSSTAETLVVFNNGGGPTGYFGGTVQVAGGLNSAGGMLKIDHPLDPANQYLNHSFVASPDMMNVYNGNVVLDTDGEAWVKLPDYFEALNRDFRYQLTPIGAPAPNLYIAVEISGNRFKIAGGLPGSKVSWQVTGIRQDAWAVANPVSVEEEKSAEEQGFYLHPELYNQPESKNIKWLHTPKEMLTLKDGKLAVPLE